MKTLKTNNDILIAIGGIDEKVDGINQHLARLNGAVAKNVDKLAAHDVINAQTTLVLQALTKSVEDIKEEKKGMSRFWYGAILTIGMFLLGLLARKFGV